MSNEIEYKISGKVWLAILFYLLILAPNILIGQQQINGQNLLKSKFLYNSGGEAWYFKMPSVESEFGEKICIQIDSAVTKGWEGVTIDIIPSAKGCFISIYLLGDWNYYNNIPVNIKFDKVMQTPFDDIIEKTSDFIDWDLVFPKFQRNSYRMIENILRKIKMKLYRINYLDDIAVDKNGSFVNIKDNALIDKKGLNCSGFAKWVVDGLYLAKLGEGISIDFLKNKPYKERGGKFSLAVEDAIDPFFGLDWTRNLALAIDLIESESAQYGDSDIDFLNELQFFEDSGFAVDKLQRALYLLAIRRSSSFFLGSVNQTDSNSAGLRRHYHVALFFPRITFNGVLEVVVLDSGKQLTLEQFLARYKSSDDRIHLVEVEADYAYSPGQFDILSVLKR